MTEEEKKTEKWKIQWIAGRLGAWCKLTWFALSARIACEYVWLFGHKPNEQFSNRIRALCTIYILYSIRYSAFAYYFFSIFFFFAFSWSFPFILRNTKSWNALLLKAQRTDLLFYFIWIPCNNIGGWSVFQYSLYFILGCRCCF